MGRERFYSYQSELRSKNISKYKMIGIVVEMLLSKELFPRNESVSTFLNETFNIHYKEYVLKSRTTIVARCVRDIFGADENLFEMHRKKLLDFVKSDIDVKTNSKNRSDSIHKWMDGINE